MAEPSTGMTIAFDMSRLIARAPFATPTGIDRFELNYARWIYHNHRSRSVFVQTGRAGPRLLRESEAGNIICDVEARWNRGDPDELKRLRLAVDGIVPWSRRRPPRNRRPIDIHTAAVRTLRALCGLPAPAPPAAHIHVSHTRLERTSAFAWLGRRPRSLFYIHDLIPITHPHLVRPNEPGRHRRRLDTVVRHAGLILCNSKITARVLSRSLGDRRADLPPIMTLPPGIDAAFLRQRSAPAPRTRIPYFLCVGTIEPRKNHRLLLEIWRGLFRDLGRNAPRLVIAGRRGWMNADVFEALDDAEQFGGTVIEINDLGDRSLAELIAGAAALVAPSIVEGYDMPVVEALAIGTPVIASDTDVHREVSGRLATLIDAADLRAWRSALIAHANERRRIERSPDADRTWDRHFEQVEDLYISRFAPTAPVPAGGSGLAAAEAS